MVPLLVSPPINSTPELAALAVFFCRAPSALRVQGSGSAARVSVSFLGSGSSSGVPLGGRRTVSVAPFGRG